MLKRPLDSEDKENQFPSSSNEPVSAEKAKLEQSQTEIDEADEDDEEEDQGPWPIAGSLLYKDGELSAGNKQYHIYENTVPSMVSHTARLWSRKYLSILPHVNPDAYNMYIHNDFVCYGELEVLENCLLDLAKGTFLKRKNPASLSQLLTTFRRLEALTILLDVADNFTMMDDGERFVDFLRLIGACYVTVLRDLLPKAIFTSEGFSSGETKKLKQLAHQLPNFKEILQRALITGKEYLSMADAFSSYTNVLQTVYCNWMSQVENVQVDWNGKDDELSEALKHAAAIRKKTARESFDFMKQLSLYSNTYPDLGGNAHDLRLWSKAKRHLYSYDNEDEDSDANFWLQL